MGDFFVIKDAVVDASAPAEDTVELAGKREAMNQRLAERRERELKEREGKLDDAHEGQFRADAIIREAKEMRDALKTKMAEIEAKEGSSGDEDRVRQQLSLTESLDTVAVSLAAAEKHLSQHASMLPIYEVRSLQAAFKEVANQFHALQDRLQPKKKFGFSGRRNKKTERKEKEKVPAKPSSPAASFDDKNCFSVKGKKSETVVVGGSDVSGKDVSIGDLTDCRVHVLGSPSTLHATGLSNCTLLCGPVRTSVFVEDCSDSVFALACQQLRVHSTTATRFFIHVSTKAIVEDCGSVSFGPYDLSYPGMDGDYGRSGLDRSVNNWDKVEDFNWLASDKASPNWGVLPEEKWEKFELEAA